MLGYVLGEIPIVKQNLEKAVLLVILISVAPIVFEAVKAARKPARSG
jgi:membrane-associated protein